MPINYNDITELQNNKFYKEYINRYKRDAENRLFKPIYEPFNYLEDP